MRVYCHLAQHHPDMSLYSEFVFVVHVKICDDASLPLNDSSVCNVAEQVTQRPRFSIPYFKKSFYWRVSLDKHCGTHMANMTLQVSMAECISQ